MLSVLLSILICSAALVIFTWMAGAIFFDVGNASAVGGFLAIFWGAAVLGIFIFWQPAWKPFLLLLVFGGCFLCWWFSQRPSHNRQWDPHFSQLPRVELCGDAISIENVRNAEYGATDDVKPVFETRSYKLSKLCGVDALIAYWGSPWMCHPMFVFDFGSGGRVCFSIEVRYRVGQKYDFIRSIYRQQELMCVVCDERDAILRRTKGASEQELYLYRLHSDALRMRSFFLEYVNTINSLADRPRWYHGLTTNCTTSIYAQGRGRIRWDWRMLFNGRLDELLYNLKLLDQKLAFPQLKQQSRINEYANRAGVEDFGNTIRSELPGYGRSHVLGDGAADERGSYLS